MDENLIKLLNVEKKLYKHFNQTHRHLITGWLCYRVESTVKTFPSCLLTRAIDAASLPGFISLKEGRETTALMPIPR